MGIGTLNILIRNRVLRQNSVTIDA